MADERAISGNGFQCRQCGDCCRSQKVVLLTLADIFRISAELGLRPGAFFRKYCMKSARFHDQGLLRLYLKTEGGCPFLKGNSCSIHGFKPIVCGQSPFYYVESSLAALKVIGVLTPGCGIEALPYDTVARGDEARLIDMEIEVGITDEYMQRYGKFDEKTANEYYGLIREALADAGTRGVTRGRLIDESIRREAMYRSDPYYRGSTLMYLSGFYGEFRREAALMKARDPGLYVFEPAALGVIDGVMTFVLQDGDLPEVRARLAGREGDLLAKPSARSGIEYATVTFAPKTGSPAMCYFYCDPARKPSPKGPGGRIAVEFRSSKGATFAFAGEDREGWLDH
jgi:hypothetical protein